MSVGLALASGGHDHLLDHAGQRRAFVPHGPMMRGAWPQTVNEEKHRVLVNGTIGPYVLAHFGVGAPR